MNEHKRKRGKRVSHNARLFRHPKDKQPLTLRFKESGTGLSISERLAESWWELAVTQRRQDGASVISVSFMAKIDGRKITEQEGDQ